MDNDQESVPTEILKKKHDYSRLVGADAEFEEIYYYRNS